MIDVRRGVRCHGGVRRRIGHGSDTSVIARCARIDVGGRLGLHQNRTQGRRDDRIGADQSRRRVGEVAGGDGVGRNCHDPPALGGGLRQSTGIRRGCLQCEIALCRSCRDARAQACITRVVDRRCASGLGAADQAAVVVCGGRRGLGGGIARYDFDVLAGRELGVFSDGRRRRLLDVRGRRGEGDGNTHCTGNGRRGGGGGLSCGGAQGEVAARAHEGAGGN